MRPERSRPGRWLAAAAIVLTAAVLGCSEGRQPVPAKMLIHVSADGRGDYATLDEAVRRAPGGATVFVGPGRYELTRPLDVFRSLTLIGAGPRRTEIVGTGGGYVLGFSGNGTLTARGVAFRRLPADRDDGPGDVVVVLGGRFGFDRCRFSGGSGPPRVRRLGVGLRLAGDATGLIDRCLSVGNSGAGYLVEDEARPLVLGTGPTRAARADIAQVTRTGPRSAAELERFLEPIILRLMTERHVPGVVVVVVRNGRPFYASGWGYSNAARGAPMDPATTKLRVGSLAKVVTATAVLRLAERGQLDLDDDVDSFLQGFSLDPTFAQPVSVGDLLTHSGGLDDAASGAAARDARAAVPLAEFLRDHPAARIAPPGEIFSYTNNGMALAGHIVERASGRSYADYVGDTILQPLEMNDSTFAPDPEDPLLALGYRFDGQRFLPVPLDFVNEPPSTGLVTSGADMGRFMDFLLGHAGDTGVLRPDTLAALRAPRFANARGLTGSTYAFRERRRNGLRTLQHTGDWGGFASKLLLIPSQDTGLFVCSNSDDPTLREEIAGRFVDEYYPQAVALGPAPEPPGFAARAAPLTGTYRGTRYAHDTFEKIYELSSANEILVEPLGDALNVDGVRYVEVEPLLFRRAEQDEYVAFRSGPRGIDYLFQDTTTYERLAWYETHRFNRRLLIGVVLVLVVALVEAAAALPRLTRPEVRTAEEKLAGGLGAEGTPADGPRLDGAARLLAGLVAGLDLVFLAGLGLALETVDLVYGVPLWFAALLALPLAAAVLTALLVVMCVIVWARHRLSFGARIRYAMTTAAALLFVWFCAYWNLLGPTI